MKRLIVFVSLVLAVLSALTSCKGSSGSSGPAGPSGVEIYSIVANPSAVRPGANTILSVSAGDGVNSSLTYSWQADSGTLSSASTSSVTWTAPSNRGSYMVSVEVTNAAGLKATGYASILVSMSPTGLIITSVNPSEVKAGDQIRIIGAGFGSAQGTSSVSIGGAPASSIHSWSDTVITATVPAGAATGSVLVTHAGENSSPGFIVVLWAKENPENVAITSAGIHWNPRIISDGSGGAIITYMDSRSVTASDIYAQRVNNAGVVQWTATGVAISATTGNQSEPQLVSDGSGGAIITWNDFRNGNYDIYAQRVNSAGAVQWTTDGVAISTLASHQQSPQLVSDGAGGAIVTWQDARNGSADIYAQRVNSAGTVQWTIDGVVISAATGSQYTPQLISDDSGGAIISWWDSRSGNADIYAQRVNSAGAVQWTGNGVALTTAAGDQTGSPLISDGAGGAIIAWTDSRTTPTTGYDIYAQRVNSNGAVMWTANGVAISVTVNDQMNPLLISDGSGGAIITWTDSRTPGSGVDIYAQRVNSSGTVLWTANGVAICTAANTQAWPRLVSDNSGGAIITWMDLRGTDNDIYAQRVNSAGVLQWAANSVAVSTAAGDQVYPEIISDGSGGAIITWLDAQSGPAWNIYAQGIGASGRQ